MDNKSIHSNVTTVWNTNMTSMVDMSVMAGMTGINTPSLQNNDEA